MESVKYALYLRVSTERQGRSGHGIEAQRRDLNLFLRTHGGESVGEFIDVESGTKDERPELTRALQQCRKNGYVLLTSKVDRLSRDVEFIARLCKDKKLTIKVAQIPNADHFQIHLFASLAQAEREFISQRTKAALAAAKERGVVLGNPKLSEMNKQRSHKARAVADHYSHLITPLRDRGNTFQEIANILGEMNIKTVQGCKFHPMQVKRIYDRATKNQQKEVAAA